MLSRFTLVTRRNLSIWLILERAQLILLDVGRKMSVELVFERIKNDIKNHFSLYMYGEERQVPLASRGHNQGISKAHIF